MDEAGEHPGGMFRLTTRGDARWTRAVPWVVVVPQIAIVVYLLGSGPLTVTRVVPALGVALAALISCAGAIASFAPDSRAWSKRIAVVTGDSVTVPRPGRDAFRIALSEIGSVRTHPEPAGLRLPPLVQLVTEFHGLDLRRVPELTVHHSSYRRVFRTTDVNSDGPAFLAALEEAGVQLDAASIALVELTFRTEAGGRDGVSEKAVAEAKAGRYWHALRAAEQDARETERTSAVLVLLSLVLAHDTLDTARAAAEEHPGDPTFAFYLAHALLGAIGASAKPTPAALAHRSRLRAEARKLLEGVVGDPVHGEAARRELEAMERRRIAADAIAAEVAAEAAAAEAIAVAAAAAAEADASADGGAD